MDLPKGLNDFLKDVQSLEMLESCFPVLGQCQSYARSFSRARKYPTPKARINILDQKATQLTKKELLRGNTQSLIPSSIHTFGKKSKPVRLQNHQYPHLLDAASNQYSERRHR
jgi:hypothetical protein